MGPRFAILPANPDYQGVLMQICESFQVRASDGERNMEFVDLHRDVAEHIAMLLRSGGFAVQIEPIFHDSLDRTPRFTDFTSA